MFWHIRKQFCNYDMVITLKLPICVRVIGSGGELLYPEENKTDPGLLSVNIYESISFGMTKLFKNNVTICIELVLSVRIARVNWENLLVMIMTWWFPFVILDRGFAISMATNARDPAAEKNWGFCLHVIWDTLWAHEQHYCPIFYTSFAMGSQ